MVSIKQLTLATLRLKERQRRVVELGLNDPAKRQLLQRYARSALNPRWYGRHSVDA